MRGKKPLTEVEVKSLRKLLEEIPLHSLLLNIGVDTMLRGSDLLNLRTSDLVTESGKVKTEVHVRMMKTKKNTLLIPLFL
jgi:integrase